MEEGKVDDPVTEESEACDGKSASETTYECPVCMDYMLPPIFQCYNGHPICNLCEPKIEVCPVCRDELPKTRKIRSLILEGIVVGLTFDCKNYDQGCTATLQFNEIEEHSWDCQFAKLPICSHLGYKCDAKKTPKEILSHLKSSVHSILGISFDEVTSDSGLADDSSGSIPIEVVQSVSMTRLEKGDRPMWTPHYFQFHGRLFFLITTYDPVDKTIMWTIALLGGGMLAKEFVARIKLMPKETGMKFVEWQGEVIDLKNTPPAKPAKNQAPPTIMHFNISLKNLIKLCNVEKTKAKSGSAYASAYAPTSTSAHAQTSTLKKDQSTSPAQTPTLPMKKDTTATEEIFVNWRLQIRFAQLKKEENSNFEWREKMAGVVMDSVISYERQRQSLLMAAEGGGLKSIAHSHAYSGAGSPGPVPSNPFNYAGQSNTNSLPHHALAQGLASRSDAEAMAHVLNLMRLQNNQNSLSTERGGAASTSQQENVVAYMRRQRLERRRREQGN